MNSNFSYLAVVPAYNEVRMIARVVHAIRDRAPEFDVVVIDDGSTDDTAVEAESAGATVVRHPFNLGIGGAVQSGFTYALENDYDRLVQIDGDGQHDPAEVRKLIAAMDADHELDMVCGSRFVTADTEYVAPISRRTGIHIFAFLLSRIVGQRVTDPTSGFRLFNRRGIALFARDYPHDYPEVEAVLLMHAHQLASVELPVKMRERSAGVSSINSTRSVYYMIKVLLAVFVGLFRARPTVRAGGPAPVAGEPGI